MANQHSVGWQFCIRNDQKSEVSVFLFRTLILNFDNTTYGC